MSQRSHLDASYAQKRPLPVTGRTCMALARSIPLYLSTRTGTFDGVTSKPAPSHTEPGCSGGCTGCALRVLRRLLNSSAVQIPGRLETSGDLASRVCSPSPVPVVSSLIPSRITTFPRRHFCCVRACRVENRAHSSFCVPLPVECRSFACAAPRRCPDPAEHVMSGLMGHPPVFYGKVASMCVLVRSAAASTVPTALSTAPSLEYH